MARSKNKKAVWVGLLMILFLVFPFVGLAQNGDYELLAPLPNLEKVSQNNPLGTYIPYIFRLAIGLAAVAAVVMIVLGGVQYMTTDAIQGKEQGKARIKNAIIGLVLVISAWLILNTINPNLLDIDLTIEPAVVSKPAGGSVQLGGEASAGTGQILQGYALTENEVQKHHEMVNDLKKYGVGINNNGKPCANGETSGCTNLVGMTSATYQGLKDLSAALGCKSGDNKECIVVTGGTEGGHRSHGPSKNPVDLRIDAVLDKYVEDYKIKTFENGKEVANPRQSTYGPVYTVKVGNRNATFLKESNPPHWHVVFE